MKIQNIIFIDKHSKKGQHLSGNISFIKNCIHYLNEIINQDDFSFTYLCDKSSYKYARDWSKELKLNNLNVSSKNIILRKEIIIYLYPEYKDILFHLYLKLKGNKIIAVSHGHLNSFNDQKDTITNKLKNNIKTLFFQNFNNILCYSNHIKEIGDKNLPKLISKKLSVISEIINLPKYEKTVKVLDHTNTIIVAFIRNPSQKIIKNIYENLKSLDNLKLLIGFRNSTNSQNEYFKFILNSDIMILDKIHDYPLQVSGIVNDCIALGTIPIGTKLNMHLNYLKKCGLIKNNWNVENISINSNNLPKSEDIKQFKLECIKWINDEQRKNKSEFLRIIKNLMVF